MGIALANDVEDLPRESWDLGSWVTDDPTPGRFLRIADPYRTPSDLVGRLAPGRSKIAHREVWRLICACAFNRRSLRADANAWPGPDWQTGDGVQLRLDSGYPPEWISIDRLALSKALRSAGLPALRGGPDPVPIPLRDVAPAFAYRRTNNPLLWIPDLHWDARGSVSVAGQWSCGISKIEPPPPFGGYRR